MLKACMVLIGVYVLCTCLPLPVMPMELSWDDIGHFPWPIAGSEWVDKNESQKAAYLERVYSARQYCIKNSGKLSKDLDLSQSGPYIVNWPRITPEVIAMYYRMYGDLKKAAKLKYKYWLDSNHKPLLGYPDESPMGFVMDGFEEAGMYKELAEFYPTAHKDLMRWLAASTDTKLLKTNFKRYKQNWPEHAERYDVFMQNWERAKKLAKTTKPKPLDPAVQHHEWFYSDKQEEVLKALEYYHKHDVRFMLEKALKHKDSVIAAKAREYLDAPVKEKEPTGDGNKK